MGRRTEEEGKEGQKIREIGRREIRKIKRKGIEEKVKGDRERERAKKRKRKEIDDKEKENGERREIE
jgi:hypothetical protein